MSLKTQININKIIHASETPLSEKREPPPPGRVPLLPCFLPPPHQNPKMYKTVKKVSNITIASKLPPPPLMPLPPPRCCSPPPPRWKAGPYMLKTVKFTKNTNDNTIIVEKNKYKTSMHLNRRHLHIITSHIARR